MSVFRISFSLSVLIPNTSFLRDFKNDQNFFAFFIFSSTEPKAHGELIGYPWSGARRRRPSTISKVFSSETAWPIKAKFHVEPP